ncbi:cysteine-rich small domain-containing protein [Christensenellaceae bacterium OttesenSCG-928-M15]|nr:cysteine-rich small domain-containing protein [Christensenellaceae bacterium OttesenSCG-928-M15]
MENSYKFFQNRDCAYFPCHRVEDESSFNCLFCYCPLYALNERCGGDFSYTKDGIKDCSSCLIPHRAENYERITGKVKEVIQMVQEMNRKE